MSKYLGKFRKDADYNDDYDYEKKNLHKKRRRSERSEIKKLKYQEYENMKYGQIEDFDRIG